MKAIAFLRELRDHLLTASGAILFTSSRISGMLFFLALALDPQRFTLALLGALTGLATGYTVSRNPVWQELGFFGGSGMLSALALTAYVNPGWQLPLLVVVCAGLSVLLLLVLAPLFAPWDLPVLALPFVGATLIALSAAPAFGLSSRALHGVENWLFPFLGDLNAFLQEVLPTALSDGLNTFGSLLFFPAPLAGIIVLAGILAGSRITAMAMLAGALFSTMLLTLLSDGILSSGQLSLLAFNGVLIAAAFCGIFVTMTRQALLYGAAALLTGILMTASLDRLLAPFDLPVLALPFCITVLLFLLPLKSASAALERWRIWSPPLHLIGRAEDNLRAFSRWQREQRQPSPVLTIPLHGIWTVTQGPNGSVTHNTETGSEAWDFMLLDAGGRGVGGMGLSVEDFYGFGCPVLAPAEGQVVAMEGQHRDNPVHSASTENPWGNWVMIRHSSATVSLLAHLRAGSISVYPGQIVSRGQEIAQLGNTGRSPEPHLHCQLNESPWLAGQSLPAVFGSWLCLNNEQQPVFHPLGRPQEGDRVCTLTHMHWPDWSAFHPLSVPGRQFNFSRHENSRVSECTLRVISGSWGRILLDDGLQRALVLYWPGWVQLVPLEDGDPDWRALYEERSLVQQLLLYAPVLPLMGVDGLIVKDEVYSPGLAGRAKRWLSLEGQAILTMQFCRCSDEMDRLSWTSQLVQRYGTGRHATCEALGGQGLNKLKIKRPGMPDLTFVARTEN